MNVMSAIPTMLVIWGVVTISFLALVAYRSQITRYEEDQLFLNDNNGHEQQEQNEIVRKIRKLQPYVRLLGGAASLVTVSIVGLWFYDAWQRLR